MSELYAEVFSLKFNFFTLLKLASIALISFTVSVFGDALAGVGLIKIIVISIIAERIKPATILLDLPM